MTVFWTKNKPNIAIIGDLLLDEYLEGEVLRISPEAPVPVHLVSSTRHNAGGAANTAANIHFCNGNIFLFGVIGDDPDGNELIKILKKQNINTDFIIQTKESSTIKKTRVASKHQQLLRIDWEKIEPLSLHLQDKIFKNFTNQNYDAVVISDYAKGLLPKEFLKKIITFCNEKNILCIVDPKGKDFTRYQGANIITPNKSEAFGALGLESKNKLSPQEIGRALQEKFNLENILLTMSAEGMAYIPKNHKEPTIIRPSDAKEVFDVSGAGDTVVALLALCLASKTSVEDALYWANKGAGIVVAKWGTHPVTIQELQNEENHATNKGKIFDLHSLKEVIASEQKKGKKIVFTNGCFDILHIGHLDVLEKARSHGDKLIVAINSDSSIKNIKGETRPINTLTARMRLLEGLSCVDYITWFDEDTPLNLIENLSPNALVKGGDYVVQEIVGYDHITKTGGKVLTVDLVEGYSTTNLIEKVSKKS